MGRLGIQQLPKQGIRRAEEWAFAHPEGLPSGKGRPLLFLIFPVSEWGQTALSDIADESTGYTTKGIEGGSLHVKSPNQIAETFLLLIPYLLPLSCLPKRKKNTGDMGR